MHRRRHVLGVLESPADGLASDCELIARAQAGDLAAFESLVIHYQPLVDGYVRHLLEYDPEAEDVVQETFLRAFRALAGLREPECFLPWLKSIAWRECRAWVRRQKVKRAAAEELRLAAGSGSGLGLPTELWEPDDPQGPDPWLERLEQAIEDMSEGKRAVLSLFYLEEFSQEQIAGFLEVPLGTVKRRLFEGRQEVASVAREDVKDLAERRRFVETLKRLLAERQNQERNES